MRRLFAVLFSILILSILYFVIFRDAAIPVANRIGSIFRGADPTSNSTPVQAGILSTRAVEAGLLSEGVTRAFGCFIKTTAMRLSAVSTGWKNG
jgi:hypothetical protein